MNNFINPYNFIPLVGHKEKADDGERKYTGVIKYSLLTKTPLFIPNTSNSDVFDMKVEGHKSYDFFSYNDLSDKTLAKDDNGFEPVIPGSEMRGLIRSNYEIFTNSCLFTIDDETISKRTKEVFKTGLVKKVGEEYHLYRAEDCLYREEEQKVDKKGDKVQWKPIHKDSPFIEGQKIYIDVIQRYSDDRKKQYKSLAVNPQTQKSAGQKDGYVIVGEDAPGEKKHCIHVCYMKNNGDGALIKKNVDIGVMDAVLKEYKANNASAYEKYAEQWEKFKSGQLNQEYFPVYYSFTDVRCGADTYIMLSPASITREIYQNTIKDMTGTHKRCEDKKELCPACALFGTIEKNMKVSSRLRFSDVHCASWDGQGAIYHKPVTLAPLSSPKINNMEFYYERPNAEAWFWTADYWIDSNGGIHSCVPKINGRKFYWHQLGMNVNKGSEKEATNLNITVRPVKKDVEFKGKVYFENVTKKELDTLIYVMNGGDDSDLRNKKHGYKLGGAKPLGYGSIGINVDDVLIHIIKKNADLKTVEMKDLVYSDYAEPKVSERESDDCRIKKAFAVMTCFDSVPAGADVSYPKIPGSEDIFDWFGQNHGAYKTKKTGEKVSNGMPNARKQQVYMEYMKPLVPKLQANKCQDFIVCENKKFDKGGNSISHYHQSDKNQKYDRQAYHGKVKCYVQTNKKGNIYTFVCTDKGEEYYVPGYIIKREKDQKKFVPNAKVDFELKENEYGKIEVCKIWFK